MTARDATRDESISNGDTVYIAWVDHPCAERGLGRVYVFKAMPTPHPGIRCQFCGQPNMALPDEPCHSTTGKNGVPKRWLKKIPPLTELEGVKQKEDIREPA